MTNFLLFTANGKRKFVFLGQQTIYGNRLRALSCQCCHVPAILPLFPFPGSTILTFFSGCPVLPARSQLFYSIALARTSSRLSSLAFLSQLSGLSYPVLAVLSQLGYTSCPVPAVFSQLSCSSCFVQTPLSTALVPSSLDTTVMSWQSCPLFPI
jgi:hypothetical protein